jgi:hypothetical protein
MNAQRCAPIVKSELTVAASVLGAAFLSKPSAFLSKPFRIPDSKIFYRINDLRFGV